MDPSPYYPPVHNPLVNYYFGHGFCYGMYMNMMWRRPLGVIANLREGWHITTGGYVNIGLPDGVMKVVGIVVHNNSHINILYNVYDPNLQLINLHLACIYYEIWAGGQTHFEPSMFGLPRNHWYWYTRSFLFTVREDDRAIGPITSRILDALAARRANT